jgi:hypothetical protein
MISNEFTAYDHKFYKNSKPFNYIFKDNFLTTEFALRLQKEILEIPNSEWDRYNNPFENKYTLRNKFGFTPLLSDLFKTIESTEFIKKLQVVCDIPKLYPDQTRNFWGVHKFKNGDKLDIHLDAGLHPHSYNKKQITLGIYLTSENWSTENRGNMEFWEGDEKNITKKAVELEPKFNRMILFNNTDNSWHGSPDPVISNNTQHRIFITMSYMSDLAHMYNNTLTKAYFTPRPQDEWDEEKKQLRMKRCDPVEYSKIYR